MFSSIDVDSGPIEDSIVDDQSNGDFQNARDIGNVDFNISINSNAVS